MDIVREELTRRCDLEGRRAIAAAAGVSIQFLGNVIRGNKRPGPKILGYLQIDQVIEYRWRSAPPGA